MKMHELTVPGDVTSQIRDLLGPCVLLACSGKRPTRPQWTSLTLDDMTPQYLASLTGNIGVSLGERSAGLVVVDIDDEDSLDDFMEINPWACETLRTRGNRGASFWFRIADSAPIPASCKLTNKDNKPAGEWRATGNQSIIHGIHPENGQPYRRLVDCAPMTIPIKELCWPMSLRPKKWRTIVSQAAASGSSTQNVNPAPPAALDKHLSCTPSAGMGSASLPSQPAPPASAQPPSQQVRVTVASPAPIKPQPRECDVDSAEEAEKAEPSTASLQPSASLPLSSPLQLSAYLHHTSSVDISLAALKAEGEFEARFPPGVVKLYRHLIERRYSPAKAARNAFIIHAVPFLFRALDVNLILEFSLHFYRLHQSIFKDVFAQHEAETKAAITGVTETYLKLLPPDLKALYLALPQPDQATFRICQDLARNTSNADVPPPYFFLSSSDLADRTLKPCQVANRSLWRLCRIGVIEIETPGIQRAKNQRGRATKYKWLHTL